ncbi:MULTISPECIES: LysR family transcriptional regulator [Caballeronia]|jgi:DNA-binding transcriptional LysR family regulator|uniref:LysR family transcriptional regulator n=1 Tax=Caballeronia zhejiangensis TaxID=871203 RepID=A0A656QC81_9BURK|nr:MULTISPECIES: LysR family transcriptional regulator [Caballeronia]EKS70076.1 LysR family transcriptional regulator [Burkholderia sp. SJ98]KDR27533.1 LysR family transcriptional regulator [Caballeronia zhejiangensis]MCG7400835.1 LysR family transcriptional regulator [Caballeronia zhejiangensis]MCI1043342.1 LysR family transcriptional regulator [Caballeronia zhejiangensis]MDR5767684.1 LysR family transcriptional regulator [Caballeronia sp. LZ028]
MAFDLTLRQLRYFVAAAQTGQFSMAAANEHVSQSAITNAVLALESALGTKLFERLPQGVALTPDGQDFHNHARRVLDAARDAMHMPPFRAHDMRGVARIAASYTVLGYFLPELLARFRATYPFIDFDLRDMERPQIEEAVANGDVDIGVVLLSNLQRPNRFDSQVLMRSRRQLWVAPMHPLAQQHAVSLKDIAVHPYILITVDEGEQSTMRYWHKKRIEPNIAFRTSSMEALRGLVAHGFGVTVLSDMVFRPWSLEGKRIEARPVNDAIPHMEAGMIWRKGATLSAPSTAVQQFLIHACGA